MNVLFPSSLKECAFAGAGAFIGRNFAQNAVYQNFPAMVSKTVIKATTAGLCVGGGAIGASIAPFVVVQVMPAALTAGGIFGTIIGTIAGKAVYEGSKFAGNTLCKTYNYATEKLQDRNNGKNWHANTTSVEHEKTACEFIGKGSKDCFTGPEQPTYLSSGKRSSLKALQVMAEKLPPFLPTRVT